MDKTFIKLMSELCCVIVAMVVGRYVTSASINLYVEVPQWFTELQPTWIESLKLLKELSGLGLPASTSMFVGAVAGDISWEYLHAGG